MKRFLLFITASVLSLVLAAQSDVRRKQFNLSKSSVALEGYDPVAYFKQNKAVAGSKSHALVYEGVTYFFSSAENKLAFAAKPAAYEPQYGGWCAYAMGHNGEKVEVDPETFKIADGKLYLFYNKFFNNTLKSWNKDEAGLKAKAEVNWTKFTHK